MFCTNCGNKIDDNSTFCPYCGVAVNADNNAANTANDTAAPNPTVVVATGEPHGIALAAKIFIIIGMVVGFWYILPLIFGGIALSKMKNGKPSTGISVCVLLFCNIVAGICMLCSKDSDYV